MEYPTQPTLSFTAQGRRNYGLRSGRGWLAPLGAWWLRMAAPAPHVDLGLLTPQERHTLRRGALLAWFSLGLIGCLILIGLGEIPDPSTSDEILMALMVAVCLLTLHLLNRRGHVDAAAIVLLTTLAGIYLLTIVIDVKVYGGFDPGSLYLLTLLVLIGALVMQPIAGFAIPLLVVLATEIGLIAVVPPHVLAPALQDTNVPVGSWAFDYVLLLSGPVALQIATAIIATAANRTALLALRELDRQTGALQVREAFQQLIQEGDEAVLMAFNAFVYDGDRGARCHLPDGHPRQHLVSVCNLLLDQLDRAYHDRDNLQMAETAWTQQGRYWRRLPEMHTEREQLDRTSEEAIAAGIAASVYVSTNSCEPARTAIEHLRAWETYREHELLAASMAIISAIHRRLTGQAGARVPDTVARSPLAPLAHEVNRLLDQCEAAASGRNGPTEADGRIELP